MGECEDECKGDAEVEVEDAGSQEEDGGEGEDEVVKGCNG